MVYAIAAIAFLGFGVWVHHMFTTGLGPTANAVFAGTTMLIAIPTGVKIFNWIGTMVRGSLKFTTPMLFAVGLVSQFTIGGLSGVMHASPPVDAQHNDTYFVIAHFHYVLFGGSIFGLLAGIYYWFPKFTGRMMDERIGKINFWMTFIGFNATFFPMHFLGLDGMPRRYYTYGEGSGWRFWNVFVTLRRVPPGGRYPALRLQPGAQPPDTARLPDQTRGMRHARVVDPVATAGLQLRAIPQIGHRDPLWWDKYGIHEDEDDVDITIAGQRCWTVSVSRMTPAMSGPIRIRRTGDPAFHQPSAGRCPHSHAEPVVLPGDRGAWSLPVRARVAHFQPGHHDRTAVAHDLGARAPGPAWVASTAGRSSRPS